MSDDFDIIIIGAGIAGTACALRCVPAMWYWRKGQQPAGRALWIPASSLDNRNGIKETLALDKGIFRDLTQHTDVILKSRMKYCMAARITLIRFRAGLTHKVVRPACSTQCRPINPLSSGNIQILMGLHRQTPVPRDTGINTQTSGIFFLADWL